jgi:hypothetical protein
MAQEPNELHIDKESILEILSDLIKGEEDLAAKEGDKIDVNEDEEKQKIEMLCTVWDLSASKDVANYLYDQCHVVEVLLLLLGNDHAHTYRLFEVAIGTLANLCSTDERIALAFVKVSML